MQQIVEEEDQDYYDEAMLVDIEEHAGTALDRAQLYIEDFQKSKIELLASVHGYLFAQGSLSKSQYKRYFKLRADCGVLIKFDSLPSFESLQKSSIDILSMSSKAREKNKVEVIDFE